MLEIKLEERSVEEMHESEMREYERIDREREREYEQERDRQRERELERE